jgi:hypothetical protein
MKDKFIIPGVIVGVLLFFSVLPRHCLALDFLDGRLRVKGSLYEFMIYRTAVTDEERQYRDTEWGLMRTKGTLELLYKAVDNDKHLVNLFGFFQYWHESVPDFDNKYRRSISSRNRKAYQGPSFDQDDWINEAYADIYSGPWNIRLGKQIVFWSEVEMVRTIDRINTLDLRYTTPGIDPWDEIKLGLWMMRGFYNSTLPGQLVFEWIWIPGDFEQVRTPTDGTSMAGGVVKPQGPKNFRPRPFGQKSLADLLFQRARPAFTLSNSSWALRVRGNSQVTLFKEDYLLDWTVSWFHGMETSPVARTKTVAEVNSLLGRNAQARIAGDPLPQVPYYRLFEYKFFDAVGTSCQTLVPAIQSVVRGELSYEIGVPINTTFPKHIDASGQLITGNSERDQVNIGLTVDRPVIIPWLQDRGWDAFDCSLGWSAQWRLGNVSRRWSSFGWGDRSQSNLSALVKGRFYHQEFRPVIRFLYNTRNWGYGVVACQYAPGEHMRYELGFLGFFANDPTDSSEASMEQGDCLYFRMGYEF